MNINLNLFDKYEKMLDDFKPDGTLFGIEPLYAITHRVCPYCFCKLYEMRTRPFFYCKSKKHKQTFLISKDKVLGKA